MKKRLLSNVTGSSLWAMAETEREMRAVGDFALICAIVVV